MSIPLRRALPGGRLVADSTHLSSSGSYRPAAQSSIRGLRAPARGRVDRRSTSRPLPRRCPNRGVEGASRTAPRPAAPSPQTGSPRASSSCGRSDDDSTFDLEGRLMVTQEGLLPCRKITKQFNQEVAIRFFPCITNRSRLSTTSLTLDTLFFRMALSIILQLVRLLSDLVSGMRGHLPGHGTDQGPS